MRELKNVSCALEKWEERLRRQQEATGEAPLNNAYKRTVVMNMMPDELGNWLKLNAAQFDSYDKMRHQIMYYMNLKVPINPTAMNVDYVEQDTSEWQHYQPCFEDEVELDFVSKGGKSKGKSKGKGDGKGKNGGKAKGKSTVFPGNCNWCHEYGHKAADCKWKQEWLRQHGKGKSKGKGVHQLEEDSMPPAEVAEMGGLELCSLDTANMDDLTIGEHERHEGEEHDRAWYHDDRKYSDYCDCARGPEDTRSSNGRHRARAETRKRIGLSDNLRP